MQMKERALQKAIRDAQKIGMAKAARKHKVPYSTLRLRIEKCGIEVPRNILKSTIKIEDLAILQALFPGIALTSVEIAEACGVSKTRIQQITNEALRKLRNELWKQGIKGYY